MPFQNKIIIAAAGSGKTTRIVKKALALGPNSRVLITTFTLSNVAEIRRKFEYQIGYTPSNVTILPWFTFVLRELARPYQNSFFRPQRIVSLHLVNGRSDPYAPKSNPNRYFFGNGPNVYSDKLSELALTCNRQSAGMVLDPLEGLVDHLFIDEVQDLAGYDLELLKIFLVSNFDFTIVGDYRQATLATNQSPKHKKYRYSGIIKLFQDWEKNDLCSLEFENNSYRCCQAICDFSDLVFPDGPRTISLNTDKTEHEGVFIIESKNVGTYIDMFSPQVLRHSKTNKCQGFPAMNFGMSKGLTFERVLIFPTGKIKTYLQTADVTQLSNKESFYVAITRARQSVAFVYDGEIHIPNVKKFPSRQN